MTNRMCWKGHSANCGSRSSVEFDLRLEILPTLNMPKLAWQRTRGPVERERGDSIVAAGMEGSPPRTAEAGSAQRAHPAEPGPNCPSTQF